MRRFNILNHHQDRYRKCQHRHVCELVPLEIVVQFEIRSRRQARKHIIIFLAINLPSLECKGRGSVPVALKRHKNLCNQHLNPGQLLHRLSEVWVRAYRPSRVLKFFGPL